MKTLKAHSRSILSYVEENSISSPQILNEGQKIPQGKGKLFRSHYHRASYTEASVTFA